MDLGLSNSSDEDISTADCDNEEDEKSSEDIAESDVTSDLIQTQVGNQCEPEIEDEDTNADLADFIDEMLHSETGDGDVNEYVAAADGNVSFSFESAIHDTSFESTEHNTSGGKYSDSNDETSLSKRPDIIHPDYNKDKLVEQIYELANDPTCINGPEAYDFNQDIDVYKEKIKKIGFHLIANSVTKSVEDYILIWLVELRNVIFSTRVKDKSFVTRFVFDPRHRNLVIVLDGSVIGGVCFRMFPTQEFSEIDLVAMPEDRDYRTLLMYHLKDYNIKHNIYNLLAHVPSEASDYFQEQGFSNEITLPESDYIGYINVLNMCRENSLMECRLDKRITYSELPEVISRQKKIIKRLIDKYRNFVS